MEDGQLPQLRRAIMDSTIAEFHRRCYSGFVQLMLALGQTRSLFQDLVSANEVSEKFDQYKLWAGNVGAGHAGQNYRISLDYRLREAPFYKEQICEILNRLDETLERILSLVTGTSEPFEAQNAFLSVDAGSQSGMSSSDDDDDSFDDTKVPLASGNQDFRQRLASVRAAVASIAPFPGLKKPTTISTLKPGEQTRKPIAEVPQLLDTLKFTITCLYRIPLRRPATVDRASHLPSSHMAYFEPFDKAYVDERCPAASDDLKQRMQKAISRRRRILEYRAHHYKTIKSSIPTSDPFKNLRPIPDVIKTIQAGRADLSESQSNKPSEISKATTLKPADFPKFTSGALLEDNVSVAESTPSTNPSLWTGNQKLYVPPRPKASEENKPFLCPHCFIICRVKSDNAWKHHILRDLEPYICTFGNCNKSDHLFEHRDEWYEHELQNHRIEWSCNVEGHDSCKDRTVFMQHLQEQHPELHHLVVQSSGMLNRFQRPAQNDIEICPLCSKPAHKLKSHLSRHMEQIALYVLGGNNQDEADEESQASDHAMKVESSDDAFSEEESITDEVVEPLEIMEGIETRQNDDLVEESAIPDTTSEDWTTPLNPVATLNLTASVVLFLNLTTRVLWARFEVFEIPWLLWGRVPEKPLHQLRSEMTRQNDTRYLTKPERILGETRNSCLKMCDELLTAYSTRTTNPPTKFPFLASEFFPKERVKEFVTKLMALKILMKDQVLLPLRKDEGLLQRLSARRHSGLHYTELDDKGQKLLEMLSRDTTEFFINGLSDPEPTTQPTLGGPRSGDAAAGYAFQYSNSTGRRKALLIGINYFGQRGQLRECIHDIKNMATYLTECHGYQQDDMVLLTDDQQNPLSQPTKQNILRAMHWLVKDARPNDSLFFQYSGHGGRKKEIDGDEDDGYDEVIYPVDFRQVGHIEDDEMHRIMIQPLQLGVRLTSIFDSIHSKDTLDLPHIYSTSGMIK